MKLEIFKAIIATLIVSVALFFINKIVLQRGTFSSNFDLFSFSLEFIYGVFTVFSILIITTLHIVNSKNKDIVGMTFMLMTTVKAGISFFIFSKIIDFETIPLFI